MKFFIPNLDDAAAESLHEAIVKFARETTGNAVRDRRIYSLSYRHEGESYESTVGKPDGRLGETVIAILEGEVTYLVCTGSRGVARGLPLLVGKDEPFSITDFERVP